MTVRSIQGPTLILDSDYPGTVPATIKVDLSQLNTQPYQIEKISDLTLTGITPIDIEILKHLPDVKLYNLCSTNKYIQEICSGEDLWKAKIRYLVQTVNTDVPLDGDEVLADLPYLDRSVRQYYLDLVRFFQTYPNLKTPQVERFSVQNGYLFLLKALDRINYPLIDDLFTWTLEADEVSSNVFKWLFNRSDNKDEMVEDNYTWYNLVRANKLDLIMWLDEMGYYPEGKSWFFGLANPEILTWAIQKGWVDPITYTGVVDSRTPIQNLDLLYEAGISIPENFYELIVEDEVCIGEDLINWFSNKNIYPIIHEIVELSANCFEEAPKILKLFQDIILEHPEIVDMVKNLGDHPNKDLMLQTLGELGLDIN